MTYCFWWDSDVRTRWSLYYPMRPWERTDSLKKINHSFIKVKPCFFGILINICITTQYHSLTIVFVVKPWLICGYHLWFFGFQSKTMVIFRKGYFLSLVKLIESWIYCLVLNIYIILTLWWPWSNITEPNRSSEALDNYRQVSCIRDRVGWIWTLQVGNLDWEQDWAPLN